MKDLDKNVIYDLSGLNKEERTELFDYLLSVDKSYSGSKIEIKNKPTINAKILFNPKVNIINPTESNCDKTIEKDSILEVILKNKLLELRENVTDLENLLLHNTNLNDFIKTGLMKEVIVYLKTKGVLESILKDYELEKLKQQCEN